ncbi:hypothetical protein CHS0354_014903 [Potamilus streckersoni]|uniref:Uncharacterized protein n=1 Tax=Potamilus streckersoni TaxID=2493646 RepID=A0AAE0W0J9_9BIVA|nr:hypothetical protein CHS0354_014903 [Potamilus streckersoni]
MSSATPLTFYFPQKVVSEFVDKYYGETSTQAHSHYLDAENIYVKCVESTTAKGKEDLELQGEQIIKQKLISMDGERAFGWTKAGMLHIKHWGFYQTSSVTRATPKYEAYFSESFIRECNEHKRFRS